MIRPAFARPTGLTPCASPGCGSPASRAAGGWRPGCARSSGLRTGTTERWGMTPARSTTACWHGVRLGAKDPPDGGQGVTAGRSTGRVVLGSVAMLERLLIAAAILVVNGVVLVLVLRLLAMVVIRRVPSRLEESVTVPIPAPPRRKMEESPPADDDIVPAPAVPLPAPVVADVVDERPREPTARYRIHHHRMLLGVPVLAAIFASGAWLGDWVGGGSSANASTVTVHLKAQTITAPGRSVFVTVPGQTVKVKGRVVTVPGTIVTLHKTRTVV